MPRRRRGRKVRPARLPMGHAAAYLMELRRLQRQFETLVRRELFPRLESILAPANVIRPDAASARVDMTEELAEEAVDRLRLVLGAELFSTTIVAFLSRRLAVQVSGFQRTQLKRQAKRSIGIDLLIAEPWLEQHIALFVKQNVALIKSIPVRQLNEVEDIILRAGRTGARVETVRKEIQERFGIAQRRAEVIARDQTLTLNEELNVLRQQSIGLDEGTWSTSDDERVRKRHKPLHKKPFKLAVGLVVDIKTGRKAKPGEDVQCRCTTIPNFDKLLEEIA